MLFTTDWMKKIFPKGLHPDRSIHSIKTVQMDSRKTMEGGLFIPLVGERVDGHAFIDQAYENGAVAVLWNKEQPIPCHLKSNVHFFLVEDPLIAMQELARSYRLDIDPIVIGITGSNGKTTTKDLTESIMQTTYRTHATEGNLNNHIGLPLTILSMPRNTEVLILEMGMNDFGEIRLLSTIAEPDYGIVVHIGESHIEHLHSREGIAQAKLEIIDGFHEDSVLIYDGDEPLLQASYDFPTISVGSKESSEAILSDIHIGQETTTFKLNNDAYTIALLGAHHAKNASYGIMVATQLKIDQSHIKKGLDQAAMTAMRFEQITTQSGMRLINDAYNASPTSMKAAIDVVKQMDGFKERILILGDILELGEYSESYHRSIASQIESPITAVYTIGSETPYIGEELADKGLVIEYYHVQNKKELHEKLAQYEGQSTVILLKASRGIELDTLVPAIYKL